MLSNFTDANLFREEGIVMKSSMLLKTWVLCCCGLLVLCNLSGCSKQSTDNSSTTADGSSKFSGDSSGAKELVAQFVQPNADHAALTKQLKATKEDYKAIFANDEMATKAETTYAEMWNSPDAVIKPKPGQTISKVYSVSSDDIQKGTGLDEFPGGYKGAGTLFKPGLTLYKFDFLEPGKEYGMSYDALVYVNGHWRFIPKPWRLAK
jgi:hypothetical protein